MTSIDSSHQSPTTTTISNTARGEAALQTQGIPHPVARPFLLGDAALTGVNGLAYLAAAPLLTTWFGASTALLRPVGVFLIVVGLGVAMLAKRRPVSRRGTLALASLNVVWVAASIEYAVVADLTTLGTVWAVLQAGIVGAFAAGQFWFVRRG